MTNEPTVTISAAFFAELYRKANEADEICKTCKEERVAEGVREEHEIIVAQLTKDRDDVMRAYNELNRNYLITAKQLDDVKRAYDELKRDLLAITKERDDATSQLSGAVAEADNLHAMIARAEKCIEDVWNCLSSQEIADNEYAHIDIIRAYREKKEVNQ